jgi:hypothetical protein
MQDLMPYQLTQKDSVGIRDGMFLIRLIFKNSVIIMLTILQGGDGLCDDWYEGLITHPWRPSFCIILVM